VYEYFVYFLHDKDETKEEPEKMSKCEIEHTTSKMEQEKVTNYAFHCIIFILFLRHINLEERIYS